MTRRVFHRVMGGAVLSACRAAFPSSKLSWAEPGAATENLERRYRADAQVIVFSVPLLHRSGVGAGSVVWRETAEPGGGLTRLLEFNGYSLPAHAGGLNRLGFIREMTRLPVGGDTESIYFGLMTASPEESAEQARRALQSKSKEQAYTAIDGRLAPGVVETKTAHFSAPAAVSAEHRRELMDRAQQALAGERVNSTAPVNGGGAPTFLQELAEMLRRPEREQGSYVYAGQAYTMRIERSPDASVTAYFRARRMMPAEGNVIRVTGKLRRTAGGPETDFRLWVEQGSQRPIPLRIEYRAKSYLRLVFEAVPA